MHCKIILVAQQKGGVGKSTIAINIAIALIHQNFKVAIIDTDPQNSIDQWLKIRNKNDIADVFPFKLIISSTWKLASEITSYKLKYDFIIIDSPPHMQSDIKSIMKHANLIILPLQPAYFDICAIHSLIEICQKEDLNFKILLNRVSHFHKFSQINHDFNKFLLNTILHNRVDFCKSLIEGLGVIEYKKNSLAAKEVNQLISEIKGLLI